MKIKTIKIEFKLTDINKKTKPRTEVEKLKGKMDRARLRRRVKIAKVAMGQKDSS